ncbi:hypothetical protein TVAG_323970 [Trichomonas vaginalis G3]|uniref:Uncharacterized protein n=1 Tax=Trichomonas vaginalis (strain ATCC PRA-98 / G3) TaxID=412133 RepID=A2F499_TRIV3|nr:hypothetical protein TVAGG3_1029080 [Trichomonas vaginalis G3]EAY00278.1 hypothetical protein TVAG_323970 [Trichomonas vaginalis G3]KAI5492720.1 hypothetical protein TVAGG3_1029080 [Trichomonas vaginalis G3]|eukprot:XP_001313207.1 hypothetical protein [Trichomonas vaginalis G3]
MLSLLIFFSISESNPISGCENIASEEIKAGFTLVKTIESNGILCFKGSALLKADKNFVATYAFVSENSASTSTMTKENPFLIGSGDKTTYIKIAPKDPNEKLQISLTGARLSSNSASLFKVGVFSTLKYFQKSISISNTQNLHLVAINEVPFRFT